MGPFVGIIGGEGDGGGGRGLREELIAALVRGLECLLAQSRQISEAAVDSMARGCQADRAQQAERFGGEGADGCVLDSYRC